MPRPAGADHPRIRGEHASICPDPVKRFGSSPHTRGARACGGVRGAGPGIIPAYAGSTSGTSTSRDMRTDHPRIRGEHPGTQPRRGVQRGSSPHTRGAPSPASRRMVTPLDHPRIRGEHYLEVVVDPVQLGIIPAYAGSTPGLSSRADHWRDHPRIRGEHPKSPSEFAAAGGSSPHTRGAHPDRRRMARLGGIIPAYAGSTSAHR